MEIFLLVCHNQVSNSGGWVWSHRLVALLPMSYLSSDFQSLFRPRRLSLSRAERGVGVTFFAKILFALRIAHWVCLLQIGYTVSIQIVDPTL